MLNDVSNFFVNGGYFMYPLALCSILLVAAIVFRLLNVRRGFMAPPALVDEIENCLEGRKNLEDLSGLVQAGRSPLSRLVRFVLDSKTSDEGSLRKMVEARAKEEFTRLQTGLPLIDMIVMIAPMFGILGTASGLVIVFASFGMEDNQGQISLGIANALNTTITGLAIATPAVIANVCFSRQLEKVSSSMESLISELVSLKCKSIGTSRNM